MKYRIHQRQSIESLLQEVSSIRSARLDASEALANIATLTLKSVDGLFFVVSLNSVRNEPPEPVAFFSPHERLSGERAAEAVSALPGTYRTRISASVVENGRVTGAIDLYFAHADFGQLDPLALARFLGEQIGLLIGADRIGRENRQLEAEVETIQRELALRKTIHRARGILAVEHNITDPESAKLLQQHSLRLGKPAGEIAEAVVAYHTRFNRNKAGGVDSGLAVSGTASAA
jgi:hypothetical protein